VVPGGWISTSLGLIIPKEEAQSNSRASSERADYWPSEKTRAIKGPPVIVEIYAKKIFTPVIATPRKFKKNTAIIFGSRHIN
jgi:hypothetical protein